MISADDPIEPAGVRAPIGTEVRMTAKGAKPCLRVAIG